MAVTITTKFYNKGQELYDEEGVYSGGRWMTDTAYYTGDVVIWESGAGAIKAYTAASNHTSSPSSEPETGGSWDTYWGAGVTVPLTLSKIVFTSPNLDSPNTAGTRSHILPGQADLGLWYEDSSNMYRISESQANADSTVFGYTARTFESFDLDNPALTLTLSGCNQDDWIEFIRQRIDDSGASYPLSYGSDLIDSEGLGSVICTCSSGTTASGAFGPSGWYVDEAGTTDHWVNVKFSSAKRVAKVDFNSMSGYEGRAFKVQGRYGDSGSYTDLYSSNLTYSTSTQTATFSNIDAYTNYRIYFLSKWGASSGMSVQSCNLYELATDEADTNNMPLYFNKDQIVYAFTANNPTSDTAQVQLEIDTENCVGSGTISSATTIYAWGWPDWENSVTVSGTTPTDPDVFYSTAVVFEVTSGEAYNCRLTAWDDATHTTTTNEILSTDRCRVTAAAFNCKNTLLNPTENEGVSCVYAPVYNRIFKGNTVYNGVNYYYGDFTLQYRTDSSVLGDFLMFKPMLYNIDGTISYGVHDFVIVLHYSYT